MAKSSKKKSAQAIDTGKLKPEKLEKVKVGQVVKDERTSKIAGAASLLFAAFLFFSFTSYLATWKLDQDKVFTLGLKIFSSDKVEVANLLGVLGAYVSHFFIYKGFGIASFLFSTFFIVVGVNLLSVKKVFSIARNLRYLIAGLLVLSVAFAYFTFGSEFPWGGAVGNLMNDWLIRWIGNAGTGALLALALISYIIWRFNPSFKVPARKNVSQNEIEEETAQSESASENIAIKEAPNSTNTLKKNGNKVVIVNEENSEVKDPLNTFDLVEKEDFSEEGTTDLEMVQQDDTIEPTKHKRDKTVVVPELEIKDSQEELPEPSEADALNWQDPLTTKQPIGDYEPTLDLSNFKYPPIDLLEAHGGERIVHDAAELEANKNQIINTLKNYDIQIQRISATVGPTVTLYEIVPAPGVRISRIKNLEDDIALSLAALGIRIIAPIPGKGTIGIEVPNVRKSIVSMRTMLASDKFQNNNFSLPIAIGKKIDNENFIVDLASMPHLLMAGATGQGKSVGINTLLVSLLYKKHPSQLKFVLVDPKKVELSLYRVIEKHFLAKLPGEEEPIITDTKKVIYTLNALCTLMDIRYDLLKEAGCRNLKEYNDKFVKRKLNPQKGHEFLPFIVLVIDEFADLIMTAGKEIEMPIARLAQLARAVGIHLIIATQRPSVNIITGVIKANFPARIAFKVSSKIDSRTILDVGGAEQLIGKGDMLISFNGEITRLQCAFVDTPEVDKVCEYISDQQGYPQAFLLPEYQDEKELEGKEFDLNDRDALFEDAARLIVQNQMGSTSLIQRRMKLGYNRAGRLMDQLEAAGIVGPNLGSKAREVLIRSEDELQEILNMIG